MLDPSEIDRVSQLTKLPIMRLVDWKNRPAEPFELRCTPAEGGMFRCELNMPDTVTIPAALALVHGDYESHKQDDGSLLYKSLPGNSMGQALTPDGRPAFGVAYDITSLDDAGRPVFKVYFGSATEWFVKNVYHAKWNELRDVRAELDPEAAPKPPAEPEGGRSKERARNPRDRARNEQRGGGGGRGGGGRGGGGRHRRR